MFVVHYLIRWQVKPTLSVHREATKGTIRPDRPKPQSVKKLKKTSRPPPGVLTLLLSHQPLHLLQCFLSFHGGFLCR